MVLLSCCISASHNFPAYSLRAAWSTVFHLKDIPWQGRVWATFTSHNVDKSPSTGLWQEIPDVNRWLCQLAVFRHPSHPPAPALRDGWCLHQLRMTQGRGGGREGTAFPSLPALTEPAGVVAVPWWLCQDCPEGTRGA